MNRRFFHKDRNQIYIFVTLCVLMIVIGYFWALWGDASLVTPVPTPTAAVEATLPSATPAAP